MNRFYCAICSEHTDHWTDEHDNPPSRFTIWWRDVVKTIRGFFQ